MFSLKYKDIKYSHIYDATVIKTNNKWLQRTYKDNTRCNKMGTFS
jgi:hypothetical protein